MKSNHFMFMWAGFLMGMLSILWLAYFDQNTHSLLDLCVLTIILLACALASWHVTTMEDIAERASMLRRAFRQGQCNKELNPRFFDGSNDEEVIRHFSHVWNKNQKL
jgi:uncharacterized membrane protein